MTTSLTSELLEATRFAPERDLQQRLRTRDKVTLGEWHVALPDGMTDPESIEAAIAYIEN